LECSGVEQIWARSTIDFAAKELVSDFVLDIDRPSMARYNVKLCFRRSTDVKLHWKAVNDEDRATSDLFFGVVGSFSHRL
jgi:hypothetical protein